MQLDDIGEVIAERQLLMKSRDGPVTAITVKLGRPVPFPDDSSYYAPFQVIGAGSEEVKYAGGVDAFQALQLAMKLIRIYLNSLAIECSCELSWDAGEEGDLGFPS